MPELHATYGGVCEKCFIRAAVARLDRRGGCRHTARLSDVPDPAPRRGGNLMPHDGSVLGREGSRTEHQIDESTSRAAVTLKPRPVCGCALCTSRSDAGWLVLQGKREKAAERGASLPAVSRETYRGGIGGDCDDCDGLGWIPCGSCSGTGLGAGWNDAAACSSCRGSGDDGDCEACDGDGRVAYQRCDACGHLVAAADLSADAYLAAARGWSGMAFVCGECVDCASCNGWVHADVVDEAGDCFDCQRKAAAAAAALFGPMVVAGLLPERCGGLGAA